ncbi:MAG TPA: TlpA family protein disulfide reductase [Gammaproteobacteria bacterium]|nr:TlpA family protein disulfide reductase [Gammaproteobacteria bacterium]
MPMLKYVLVLLLTLFSSTVVVADILLESDVEVPIDRYSGTGQDLVLWLPSEAGDHETYRTTAQALAAQGTEVWFADLLSAWFLSAAGSSLENLPPDAIAELIEKTLQQSGKRVYLMASGRGAIPLLRAARQWQLKYPGQQPLAGVILVSPNLFVRTPEPGMDGELLPIVSATNLPVYIIQPDKSPWYWQLKRTVPALEISGSTVFARYLENVRDRFYYRPDATPAEQARSNQLPGIIVSGLKLLKSSAQQERRASHNYTRAAPVAEGKPERSLRPYRGRPQPPLLNLPDLDNQQHNLADYRGQVVLVNFWASWCPPCVHEMPSMQNLQDHFAGQPFTILAVNMAEEPTAIKRFLRDDVKVSFTILQDADGSTLNRWKVFAYPTSYLIGRDGTIKYALFGAIDWDTPDVMSIVNNLLANQ